MGLRIGQHTAGRRGSMGAVMAAMALGAASVALVPAVAGATGTPPSITSVNAGQSVAATGAAQLIVITGTHLTPLTRTNGVVLKHGGSSLSLKVAPGATSTKLVATLTPTSAMVGADSVVVTTSAGTSNKALEIKAAPIATAVTPSSLVKGEQTQITLTGTGFAAGDVLASSAAVSFGPVVVNSATEITVTATVKAAATAVTQDIALRDPTTSSPAVVSRKVMPLGAVPYLDGRSVNSVFGPNTSNDPARLDGLPAGMVPTSVTLGSQGDATFTLTSGTPCATVVGKWDCTGAISVPLNAATGRRTITVNYADGTIVQIPNGFQVTPVTVSSMDGFTADGSVHKVEITGTGFWASGTGQSAQPTVLINHGGTGNTGTRTITVVRTGFADYAHVFAWVQAAPGSQGTYQVAVQDPGLRYGQSQFASVLTVVSTPDAPGAVVATANSDGTATVSWTAPADNGSAITGYTVTPYDVTTSTTLSTTNATGASVTVGGLTLGDSYTFTVTATNGNGTGAASSPSSAITS